MKNEYPMGFVHQNDHYSCGAYSFSFVLTILGIPNTLEESRKNCKTISLFEAAKNSLMRIEFVFQPTGIFERRCNKIGELERIKKQTHLDG